MYILGINQMHDTDIFSIILYQLQYEVKLHNVWQKKIHFLPHFFKAAPH